MKQKYKVTIGIPAYQSGANIKKLLFSLAKQNEKLVKIEKIIVYSDACSDNTVEESKKIKKQFPSKIQIFDAKQNKGYAFALQYIINKSNSDFLILLNDDIKISSKNMVEDLVKPMLADKDVDLVGGNIVALKPSTFIGKCVYTSYLAFLKLRINYKNGNTGLTLDGKIMGLRKTFAKSLNLSNVSTGNVDCYIYIQNILRRKKYAFSSSAKVIYRLPESIKDYRNQELRARLSYELLKNEYPVIVENEWRLPKKEYILAMLEVLAKHPIKAVIFKFIVNGFFILPEDKKFKKWDLATSTKKL